VFSENYTVAKSAILLSGFSHKMTLMALPGGGSGKQQQGQQHY